MIRDTIAHYLILEKVGEGGMGVVYKAEDTRLERFVALKFLPEEYAQHEALRERLLHEARAASALNHPNICTIYDIEQEDGDIFIAMEFLEGVSLKELVRRGPLPYDQLLAIAVDVVNGLEAAHSSGVIHRDIKLANVFVTETGRSKILDFGLARKTVRKRAAAVASTGEGPEAVEESQMSSDLAALGTAAYMSPEQALGKPLDERTDLFSFGIVLYEMATGQAPFRGDTTGRLFLSILQETPEPPRLLNPDVPEELHRIISKCLEKNRELRYQHASEIRTDLLRLPHASGWHKNTDIGVSDGRTKADVPEKLKADVRSSSWPWRDHASTPKLTSRPRVRRPRQSTKAFGAVGLVTVLLILGGLYLHSRKMQALGPHPSVVVADFANTTGDAIFDGSLRQALAMDLGQSPFLSVVSERKMAAALKDMEKPSARLSREVAREVCLRTNSKVVIASSISEIGDQYRVQLQALNCATDKPIATSAANAGSRDGVISALGRAGSDLRSQLGESLSSLEEFGTPLQQATTSSLDALRAYSEAKRVGRELGDAAALPYMQRAVQLDPNFAMANANLASIYLNTLQWSNGVESFHRAYELRYRVSQRERLYIEAGYQHVTGEREKTIRTCKEWIQLYPSDWAPHARLGLLYLDTGEFENAVRENREALRLDPGTVAPYANLMLAYLYLDRLDEARATHEEARAHHADDIILHESLYRLAFLQHDTAAMQELFDAAMNRPTYKDRLLAQAAETEAYYGRFRKARELLQQARESLAGANSEAVAAYAASAARQEAAVGNIAVSRKLTLQALAESRTPDIMQPAALAFALTGENEAAERLAVELEQLRPLDTVVQTYGIPTIRAAVALNQNHPTEALTDLTGAAKYEFADAGLGNLVPAYIRGLVYLKAQRGREAADEFRKLIDHPGMISNSVLGPLACLQLARAEEMSGDRNGALTHYQDFLVLWKDADPDIPIYRQAKAEYAKLN